MKFVLLLITVSIFILDTVYAVTLLENGKVYRMDTSLPVLEGFAENLGEKTVGVNSKGHIYLENSATSCRSACTIRCGSDNSCMKSCMKSCKN